MTRYNGNIHYVDARSGTPLVTVLDRVFGSTPGAVLKGKIQGCSGKKVTVTYKLTDKPRGIKTNTTSGAVMTKLSLRFYWVLDALRKSGPTGANNELTKLTNELKSLGLSSGVTGSGLAAQAGNGPDPKLKWTYPVISGHTTGSLFDDLLNGSKNLLEVAKILTGGNLNNNTFTWCLRLGADLHLGLHGKLNGGGGGDATIEFDDVYASSIVTGGSGCDAGDLSAVALAHELGHAYLALSGMGLDCGLGILEDVYVIGLNSNPSTCCENKFRTAYSIPTRTAI